MDSDNFRFEIRLILNFVRLIWLFSQRWLTIAYFKVRESAFPKVTYLISEPVHIVTRTLLVKFLDGSKFNALCLDNVEGELSSLNNLLRR